jgi:hypothetical protein
MNNKYFISILYLIMNKRWIGIICLVIFALLSIIYSVYIEGKNKKFSNIKEFFSAPNKDTLTLVNSVSDNLIKNGSFENGDDITGFSNQEGKAKITKETNPGKTSYVLALERDNNVNASYSIKIDNLRQNTKYLVQTFSQIVNNNNQLSNNQPIFIQIGNSETISGNLSLINNLANDFAVYRGFFYTFDQSQVTIKFTTNASIQKIKLTNLTLKRLVPDAFDLPITDGLKSYINVENSFFYQYPNILKDLSGSGNDFNINSSITDYSDKYINIHNTSIFSSQTAHDVLSINRNIAQIPFTIILNIKGNNGLDTTAQGLSVTLKQKKQESTSEESVLTNIQLITEDNLKSYKYKNILNIPGNNNTSLVLYLDQVYGHPVLKLADKYYKINYSIFSQEDNYFSIIGNPTSLSLEKGLENINAGFDVTIYLNNILVASLPSDPLYFNDNPMSLNNNEDFDGMFYSLLIYDVNLSPNQIGQVINYLRMKKLSINNNNDDVNQNSNGKTSNGVVTGKAYAQSVLGNNDSEEEITDNVQSQKTYDKDCPEVYYKNGRYWIYIKPNSCLAKKLGYCGERDYGRNRKNAKRIFETNFPNCKVPNILSGLNYEGDMSNCPFVIHQDNPCSYDECRNVDWSKSDLNLNKRCRMRVNHYCMLNNRLDPACVCWRKENMKCVKCRNWRSQFEDPAKCDLGRRDISEHPDFDQYIKKDKIPCWNCNLNAPSYGGDNS